MANLFERTNVVLLQRTQQALGADSQGAGLFVKLRGRAAQAQRSALLDLIDTMSFRITTLFLLLISSANGILAQNSGSDVCFVGLMAYSGQSMKPEEQEFRLVRRLGTFEPIVGEEERITRAFRIPGTKLFAVASVFYTDESLYVRGQYDSISLQVSISTRSKFDPVNSLQYAEAEAMYSKSYAARVYTLFKIRGRPMLIMMECRREAKN